MAVRSAGYFIQCLVVVLQAESGGQRLRSDDSFVGGQSRPDGVIIAIQKQPAANTLELTKELDGVLADIQATLPEGMLINSQLFRQADFIEHSIHNTTAALIEGALLRLRPVLMTAATTVLGLLPLLLSRGIGSEVQRPLAVVVVFGLTTSTLLTLFVVPAAYAWFAEKEGA